MCAISLSSQPNSAAPASGASSSRSTSSSSAAVRSCGSASSSASRLGKCRKSVPIPTSACLATSLREMSLSLPAKAPRATSRIRSRLRRACERIGRSAVATLLAVCTSGGLGRTPLRAYGSLVVRKLGRHEGCAGGQRRATVPSATAQSRSPSLSPPRSKTSQRTVTRVEPAWTTSARAMSSSPRAPRR